MFDNFFRKKEKKAYFALVISDRPTDGFKFESDKNCKMFMVTGETTPHDIIPKTVMKGAMEKFEKETQETIIINKDL